MAKKLTIIILLIYLDINSRYFVIFLIIEGFMNKILKFMIFLTTFHTVSLSAMQDEEKRFNESESSNTRLSKVRTYYSKCLEEHMPKVLSELTQQYIDYDQIRDSWAHEELYDYYRIDFLKPIFANELLAGNTLTGFKIYDLETNQVKYTFENDRKKRSFIYSILPLSQNKIALGYCNEILIVDPKTKSETILKIPKNFKSGVGFANDVKSLDLLAPNKLIAATTGGFITIWNLDNGECEKSFEIKGGPIYDTITSICTLPNNKIAYASVEVRENIQIMDINTGNISTLKGPKNKHVTRLVLLKNNRLAASFSSGIGPDNEIIIWDLNTEKCEKIFKTGSNSISGIVPISTDQLIIGDWHTLKVLNIKNGNIQTIYESPQFRTMTEHLCLLPGNRVAVGGSGQIGICSKQVVPDTNLLNLIERYKISQQLFKKINKRTNWLEKKKTIANYFISLRLIKKYVKQIKFDEKEDAISLLERNNIFLFK